MRQANLDDNATIYNIPFNVTRDIKLAIFQYKVVHHILPTNATLFRDKIKEKDNTNPLIYFLFICQKFLDRIYKLVEYKKWRFYWAQRRKYYLWLQQQYHAATWPEPQFNTVEPVYNGHPRDLSNWPLNTGGRLIQDH